MALCARMDREDGVTAAAFEKRVVRAWKAINRATLTLSGALFSFADRLPACPSQGMPFVLQDEEEGEEKAEAGEVLAATQADAHVGYTLAHVVDGEDEPFPDLVRSTAQRLEEAPHASGPNSPPKSGGNAQTPPTQAPTSSGELADGQPASQEAGGLADPLPAAANQGQNQPAVTPGSSSQGPPGASGRAADGQEAVIPSSEPQSESQPHTPVSQASRHADVRLEYSPDPLESSDPFQLAVSAPSTDTRLHMSPSSEVEARGDQQTGPKAMHAVPSPGIQAPGVASVSKEGEAVRLAVAGGEGEAATSSDSAATCVDGSAGNVHGAVRGSEADTGRDNANKPLAHSQAQLKPQAESQPPQADDGMEPQALSAAPEPAADAGAKAGVEVGEGTDAHPRLDLRAAARAEGEGDTAPPSTQLSEQGWENEGHAMERNEEACVKPTAASASSASAPPSRSTGGDKEATTELGTEDPTGGLPTEKESNEVERPAGTTAHDTAAENHGGNATGGAANGASEEQHDQSPTGQPPAVPGQEETEEAGAREQDDEYSEDEYEEEFEDEEE